MEASLQPLTDASRGVALWLGAALLALAVLTAAGVARPVFINEPEVLAGSFLLGALVAAAAVWRREPAVGALCWAMANVVLAAACVAFPVALGLAPS